MKKLTRDRRRVSEHPRHGVGLDGRGGSEHGPQARERVDQPTEAEAKGRMGELVGVEAEESSRRKHQTRPNESSRVCEYRTKVRADGGAGRDVGAKCYAHICVLVLDREISTVSGDWACDFDVTFRVTCDFSGSRYARNERFGKDLCGFWRDGSQTRRWKEKTAQAATWTA